MTHPQPGLEEDDLFLMANLSPARTGLPFVVWISPRGNAQHDIRVKVSRGPAAHNFVTVALRPLRVIGGELSAQDLELLRRWVELNWDVLRGYWDGSIQYTEDAIAQLRSIA
ncbi:MAG: hypothetical protein JO270_22040 [Acidobacteriaceae bacterium]|nr:hypothetical protein [Acidobacteriaceae bacterium]MBV8573293.1 hypothetical protein [Acidobacteriaceae bacterium]